MENGTTKKQRLIHIRIDVSKDKLAVAIVGIKVRDDVYSLGTYETVPPVSTGYSRNFPA
jgi:hypothetical protein